VDISPLVSEFIEELLGLHGAYSLTEVQNLDSAADAAAVVRLRVRLCDALMADGWQPSAEAARQLEADRALLQEPDDDASAAQPQQRAAATNGDGAASRDKQPTDQPQRGDPRDELTQMRSALESRAVIEQAKGIAMERYGLRAEVAWSWLVRTSQNRNVKLRVLAEELVSSVGVSQRPASDAASPRRSLPSG
jgi:ANTAR domain-containing protein